MDLIDNAKEELVLTRTEQEELFEQSCDMVLNKTRWVLDNLDNLCEYGVNWEDYHSKEYRENRPRKPKAL